ncbi:MAG: hypothetical protein K5905_14315 [Roseibium sp.]|uniref:hypothetical protein n=1 Tax=Roseibium sp. TaxID=1936156 RepID=UPI00261BAC35|nr:hypothetical protein [Roseibium sp.]MCV0426639.1 hypothetical protein [Roseibium sp.]
MQKTHEPIQTRTGRIVLAACAAASLTIAAVQPSDAQSRRPDSRAMTCAQVQSMIDQRGAVVLSTANIHLIAMCPTGTSASMARF